MAFASPAVASATTSEEANAKKGNDRAQDSVYRSKEEEESNRLEREARSIAIEKAYVHDVYEHMSKYVSDSRFRTWPRVRQFLDELEFGSLVCDVGCGRGKYLGMNPNVFTVGSDRCRSLAQICREKDHEILHCDNLYLPFRDESLDAVLSIAVIHHVATAERRVRAIKELSRVLRVGGRLMISVWAMEQRHRKFESQDVLIPWHKPPPLTMHCGMERVVTTSGGASALSTCTTSEDDVNHYHAYSQGSDSGEWYQHRGSRRKNRNKGRSIDTSNIAHESAGFLAGQSSSDLSSPNESCYSFVRRAIQKFSTTKRHAMHEDSSLSYPQRFPWFNFDQMYKHTSEGGGPLSLLEDSHGLFNDDSSGESIGDLPIELRHLESHEDKPSSISVLDTNVSNKRNPLLATTGLSKMSKSLDFLHNKAVKRKAFSERANTFDSPPRPITRILKGSSTIPTTVPNNMNNNFAQESQKDVNRVVMVVEDNNSVFEEVKETDGLLKDLKKSLSASLRSFDFSFKSGSLSSLSSGKSIVSNYSIKSDSGIGLNPSKRKFHHIKSRTWDSEPHLDEPRAYHCDYPSSTTTNTTSSASSLLSSTGGGGVITAASTSLPSSASLLPMVSVSPALDKNKGVVESGKLMKAIKEVNESDLSENTTPVNSPGPLQILAHQAAVTSMKTSGKKHVLVKQKPSFYFPDTPSSELVSTNASKSESSFEDKSKSLEYDSDKTPCIASIEEIEEDEEVEKETTQSHSKQVSFEDIKEEVKSMPLLKSTPFLLALPPKGILKQRSLNDELFSKDRVEANIQVRKKLLSKQRSLPESKTRSLKDSVFALAKCNNKRFENLKNTLLRSQDDSECLKSANVLGGKSGNDVGSYPSKCPSSSSVSEDGQDKIHESKSTPVSPRNTTTIRRGFVRIFSNWSSTSTEDKRSSSVNYSVDDPSFTLKKGVTIQPLDVRGRDILDSATRRSLFQRRTHHRGAASPLSPQQLEALTKENVENLSPTLRRCCLDCSGGDLVVVERERKLSRGDNASDSSSKDGSIQSDTSLDSEDSCVSVIFIPPSSDNSNAVFKKQRSTSNSSESSESAHSGRVSPMSPGGTTRLSSPVKGNGKIGKFKSEEGSKDAIYILEQTRTLEKIDERHTESESEEMGNDKEDEEYASNADMCLKLPEKVIEVQKSIVPSRKASETKNLKMDDSEVKEIIHTLPKFFSHLEKKSFEMEDIPNENPIKNQTPNIATRPLGLRRGSVHTSSLKNKNSNLNYPIVRHHPLFAKQPKTGSNFSSLLAGKNVRIIRQRGEQALHCFEIFNPETDDLDSDTESSSSSSTTTDDDSNASVESVVSARDTAEKRRAISLEQNKPPTVIITDEDVDKVVDEVVISDKEESTTLEDEEFDEESAVVLEDDEEKMKDCSSTDSSEMSSELMERSERRRQSLLDLLDENLVILNSIGIAAPTADYISRREKALAKFESQNKLDICFESSEELQESGNISTNTDNNLGSNPLAKEELRSVSSINQRTTRKPLLFKAQSFDNPRPSLKLTSSCWITKSVDCETEEAPREPTLRKKPPMLRQASAQSDSSCGDTRLPNKLDIQHCHPESSSSILSCCSSDGSSSDVSGRISKTPSPNRGQIDILGKKAPRPQPKRPWMRSTSMIVEEKKSEAPIRSRRVSGSAVLPGIVDDDIMAQTESLLKDDGTISASKLYELDPRYEKTATGPPMSDTESICSFPYRRLEKQKLKSNRDDSMESSSTSAKSSVQHSDTSSLFSHRFSTISISSNVSSEVSFGNTSIVSGSSCYLASMSSADFDDRPGLVSSFSLSEADENEYLQNMEKEQTKNRMDTSRAKSVFRREENQQARWTHGTNESESTGRTKSDEDDSLVTTRLRLPTETSIETSIENPAYTLAQEEKLFRKMGDKEEGVDEDDQVSIPPKSGNNGKHPNAGIRPLSGASSQESLHSDSSQQQTQHRYYHVFREGELDHLINTYVENLHIINSYYDHSNWCIVAEKVNVWTI
ncbi:uncharacterized protein fid [Lepeophtheirus salmonis]|uniref:uncharacterized protein fid n=1 Tax=Lepeophtheirus salmonis TaxID=72036 RepID=UPI001AE9AF78|nr:uncharacterized protein LOC121117087 [Lepeophtheirus salmonis]